MADDLVKVAGAQNQPEAEFIQGLLRDAGVPSVVRRSGGADVPDFLAAGWRDVLVPASLAEVRVPVPDRPGVLAEVTTLASELQVDIADLEIAHSSEGDAGVLILTVDDARVERLRGGLVARGFKPSARRLS